MAWVPVRKAELVDFIVVKEPRSEADAWMRAAMELSSPNETLLVDWLDVADEAQFQVVRLTETGVEMCTETGAVRRAK